MAKASQLAGFFAVAVALATTPAQARKSNGDESAPRQTAPWLADPYPSTYRPLPRADLILTGATLLDGTGKRIDNADLLIRDGKIVAVGQDIADHAGARVIDAKGRWVTPGVIDVHTHAGTFNVPITDDDAGFDVSEGSDPNVAETWIQHAINPQDTSFSRALQSGVTTLQILPGSSPIFGGRSLVVHPITAPTAAQMKFPDAPIGLKMACGENPKGTERGPTSRQGEVAFIRRAFLDAQEYRRDWNTYVRGDSKAPPKRDLKRETLAGILAGDIRVNLHCYRSDDIATMLGLADEFGIRYAAFHHATEAYKVPGLLRDHRTCAAVWADWWGFKTEASDAVRAGGGMLDQQDVCVVMHSDSALVGQRLNGEAAKIIGASRSLGIAIPPERAIRWLTSNPARVLGLDDRIGTLAPGFNADVVLWSGDPFSVYTKADIVLVDGAIAFDRAHPPAQPASDFELGRPGAPQ